MCAGALLRRGCRPKQLGQCTKAGARTPPSKGVPLPPRSPPLHAGGIIGPPLSAKKSTSARGSMRVSRSASTATPKAASIDSTIARYVRVSGG